MSTPNNNYFDIFTAAAYLSCAPVTVRRAVADRQIAHQRIGAGRGRIRFTREMLDAFLTQRTTQPQHAQAA
jgi:excisionase family DNA binding protein